MYLTHKAWFDKKKELMKQKPRLGTLNLLSCFKWNAVDFAFNYTHSFKLNKRSLEVGTKFDNKQLEG